MSKAPLPVEHKVKNTTAVATLLGVALAILNGIQAHPDQIAWAPVWAQTIALALVPGLAVLVTGYRTAHTVRADLTETPL